MYESIIYIDELDKEVTEHGQEITNILTHLTDPTQNKDFKTNTFSYLSIYLKFIYIFL